VLTLGEYRAEMDHTNPDAVARLAASWISRHVCGGAPVSFGEPLVAPSGGMTTFIWFGRLIGDQVPSEWSIPLALRMFPSELDDLVAQREAAIMRFVARHDYPTPCPLAVVPVGDDNPFATPWMIQPRVPGRQTIECLTAAPWTAPRLLRDLAALQVALHRIALDGCPVPYPAPLVDQWFERYSADIAIHHEPAADAMLHSMRQHRSLVEHEDPVICHGDFHPLNVLSERTASAWHHSVIDWTDVMVGDRHYDVARTVALFGVAAIAANRPHERALLRAIAPWLARTYRRSYVEQLPIDPRRFGYWQAAHLLRGWAQVRSLSTPEKPRTAAAAQVPLNLAPKLLARAERALRAATT
jgi:aminoglycoside phosphotransferase (APT) family kinase protein